MFSAQYLPEYHHVLQFIHIFTYVDNTWVKIKVHVCTEPDKSVDGNIKFTWEDRQDCAVFIKESRSLDIEIHWKSTHTDQDLLFDSHHSLLYSSVLHHQFENVLNRTEAKDKEQSHFMTILKVCGYAYWGFVLVFLDLVFIDRGRNRLNKQSKQQRNCAQSNNQLCWKDNPTTYCLWWKHKTDLGFRYIWARVLYIYIYIYIFIIYWLECLGMTPLINALKTLIIFILTECGY